MLKMNQYIGTKVLLAIAMTRGAYNIYRGWDIPADENPDDPGYLVEYADNGSKPNHPDHKGYISWSPDNAFDGAYRLCDNMPFGLALESMKLGHKVARKGWNGKDMFVVYQKGYPNGIPCNKQTAEAWAMKEGDSFVCNPYFQIQCADGSHSMWVPSINDCLADDWFMVR